MTLLIIIGAVLGGFGVGIYLLKKNSPDHYATVKSEAQNLAEKASKELEKLSKK
jgi:hypothetical protein